MKSCQTRLPGRSERRGLADAQTSLPFRLARADRRMLAALLQGGVQPVRVLLRALAVVALDRGESAPRVAIAVHLSPQSRAQYCAALSRRWHRRGSL